MKKVTFATLAALFAALMITGCATSQAVSEPEPTAEPGVVVRGATVTEDGFIIFSAEGQSIAEINNPMSLAKAKVAAETIAKANLLEVVKGAMISSTTEVENLMLISQHAEKSVSGWLARATVEIIPMEEVEEPFTNLPRETEITPEEQVVTAIATLVLAAEDVDELKPFVE